MFKKKMNLVNKVKKILGLQYCIIQKYFGTDEESANEYFEECCAKYNDEEYDVYLQKNMAYDRYQVVVERRGA